MIKAVFIAIALIVTFVAGFLVGNKRNRDAGLNSIEVIQTLEKKAEQAVEIAVNAEFKAIETRPKVEAARAKVKSLVKVNVDATLPAIQSTTQDFRVVQTINIDALFETLPEARTEIKNLVELVAALDEQVALETERGDAWKAAYEAEREVLETLRSEHATIVKQAWWQGLRRGAAGGGAVGLIILLVLL